MQTLLKTKIGPFLVISSVLAVWTLLAAQHVQAHTLTDPSCGGLPTADDFFTPAETAALAAGATVSKMATPKKGTGSSGGRTAHYYAKITVPALTAGKLMVTGGDDVPSAAALCRGSSSLANSRPSYESAHNTAAAAADTAARAETAARVTYTTAIENAADAALDAAARALDAAARALTTAENTSAATDATDAADVAKSVAAPANDMAATDEADALDTAANALDTAANALDTDIMFDPITVLISSGTKEYVVVVTIPADDDMIAALTVTFNGVMAPTTGNDADAQDGADSGSFATNNQRITHTLMTTQTTPGLLTVKTTGSAVDTVGTLEDSSNAMVAMDEDADGDGNFEIVSPIKAGATYSVFVDGQTRSERGDYGLKVDFKVASNLGDNADYADTPDNRPNDTLERGRGDYFFFTAPAAPRFLTVQTQTPTAVTTATNTTGTLFSQNGLVATDTDTGAGTNFLLRAPISVGDYIVEVKGASSSTAGDYVLVTSADEADSRGSAPDTIANTATGQTLTERQAKPYSIAVDKPGTLQVKTTGSTDTVGVLYGPAGQQLATDDDSGADKNFRITQQVEAGQHIVTVEEQDGKVVTGEDAYALVVNFVEDLSVGSEDRVAELRRERDNLQTERNTCQTSLTQLERDTAPVTVDATGFLENPSGVRSGVGLISGWVCAANDVEIRISAGNSRVATLDAAYGTTRADTVDSCQHGEDDTGFGMTYNFNHLDEGMYTIEAYADGLTNRRIGSTLTFEVVHLVDFATADLAPFDTDDTDRFLRNLDGMCSVSDFPDTGDTTMLEWEQSIQNFVISDVQ